MANSGAGSNNSGLRPAAENFDPKAPLLLDVYSELLHIFKNSGTPGVVDVDRSTFSSFLKNRPTSNGLRPSDLLRLSQDPD